jgi:cell division protein FtsA
VHCGAVVDLDEAECAIRLAVDAAERMEDRAISEVFVNVSGGRPHCTTHSACIRLPGQAVTADDVRAVLAEAVRAIDPGKRIVLHATPIRYDLDEAKGIREPEAMYGERLGVELNAVTMASGPARNLALTVERCHLSIAGLAVAAYAAGRASLVEDELNLGVTVVEMGGATTSIAVVHDGQLLHADVIPIGGHHITRDLASGVSTTIAHAERLKTLYGSALASVWDDREMIAIPLLGERGADNNAYWGWTWLGTGQDLHGFADFVLHCEEPFGPGVTGSSDDLMHFWSQHTGGAYFAFCDGSVKFLTHSISFSTFQHLGSRNGREVIEGF